MERLSTLTTIPEERKQALLAQTRAHVEQLNVEIRENYEETE